MSSSLYYLKLCKDLQNINLPNNIKVLPNKCFYNYFNLKSITLPTSIKLIENKCFDNCYKLTCINNQSLTCLTKLGKKCFHNTRLKDIEFLKNTHIMYLPEECFNGCEFERVTLPTTIKHIASCCFMNCCKLQNIIIPNSVTYIGDSCFYGCDKLTRIDLSTNLTCLPEECFSCCTNLKHIVLPDKITKIHEDTFIDCRLKYIQWSRNLKTIILWNDKEKHIKETDDLLHIYRKYCETFCYYDFDKRITFIKKIFK